MIQIIAFIREREGGKGRENLQITYNNNQKKPIEDPNNIMQSNPILSYIFGDPFSVTFLG